MLKLERVTTEYIEGEDRVRVTGQTSDAGPVILWLTRRMLDRLMATLFDILGKSYADPAYGSIRNEFAQEAAVSTLVPQPPVVPPDTEAPKSWLVRLVNVSKNEVAVVLTFKSEDELDQASLALEYVQLRQWMSIVDRAYKKGDWPRINWPDWFLDPLEGKSQEVLVKH